MLGRRGACSQYRRVRARRAWWPTTTVRSVAVPTNVVDLLTRYPVRARFDGGENRLTAAVTAALAQSHALREALIRHMWSLAAVRAGTRVAWTAAEPSGVVAQRPVFPPRRNACFLDV